MAHFAKLDTDNIVLQVQRVNDEDCLENNVFSEEKGRAFLESIHGHANWKQTSYNTFHNKHFNPGTSDLSDDQTKALRGNYATAGFSYDSNKDKFIPPKPFNSWLYSETLSDWEAPISKPAYSTLTNSNYSIRWDEDNLRWLAVSNVEADPTLLWQSETSSWVESN